MTGNPILLLLVLGPMAAGILSYLIGRRNKALRDGFAIAVTVLEAVVMLLLLLTGGELSLSLPGVCGMGLSFQLDGFRGIFATVTAYMWMMTTIFSREYLAHSRNRNRYYLFLLLTLGATMGVFLSDDLFTTFVFFELMSMASYVTVIHDEKPETLYAGGVYLAVAVIGGLVALMGIFMLYSVTGTLQLSELLAACQAAFPGHEAWFYVLGGCILFGFGAKAGMYPLHVWLPMAHPVAPAPASALLSGIITKSGIFGVLVLCTRIFAGDSSWGFVILLLGVVTMLLGGILAIFSLDLKRTLACSSMSQLGFIFVGMGMMDLLGEENALAVRGTILHMFNHSNLKLVLFMAAGVVVMNLHKLDLNDIRGFGRKKPLLCYVFLMGSLGIGGVPLFNGYVSKTLIHESIVEYIELLEEGAGAASLAVANNALLFHVIEWLFILTGGMTVAYMTKLFVVLFVEKNRDEAMQAAFEAKTNYCNKATAAVLAVSATVLPVLGVLPYLTLNKIADLGQGFLNGVSPEHAVNYFSLTNLKGGLYSILIGAVLYLVVIRGWILVKQPDGSTVYVNRWPKWLDLLELIYRPVVQKLLPAVAGFLCRCLDRLPNCLAVLPTVAGFLCRCLDYVLDGLVLLVRQTTHRQIQEGRLLPRGFEVAYVLGSLLDGVVALLNATFCKRNPIQADFVRFFADQSRIYDETKKEVMSGVSFSLLMFGVGFMVVVIYLLVV